MKSNYAKYIKEREGFDIVEDEKGFATYKVTGDECYIRDIFVRREHRQEHVGSAYANLISEIARAKGCKFLTGTVFPMANGSTESLAAILKYGFKLHGSTHEKVVLIKEL